MTTLSSRAVDVQSLRKEGEGANASTGESRRDAHTEYVLRFGQREKGAQESDAERQLQNRGARELPYAVTPVDHQTDPSGKHDA